MSGNNKYGLNVNKVTAAQEGKYDDEDDMNVGDSANYSNGPVGAPVNNMNVVDSANYSNGPVGAPVNNVGSLTSNESGYGSEGGRRKKKASKKHLSRKKKASKKRMSRKRKASKKRMSRKRTHRR